MTSNNHSSELTKAYASLTKHPEGSVKELWHISSPLMLVALSSTLMFFLDRLILSFYSLNAMNAVAIAGMTCAIFEMGAMGIANIAEVFVGQYNGAKKFNQLGKPVWQMIWFSLLTALIFVPLALWGGEIFLHDDYEGLGLPYYKILMYFGWVLPIFAALSAFYVGQGKIKLVTVSAIIGNVINLILNVVLVFGVKHIIPSMGTKGAAIATILSECIQIVILGSIFFNKNHRVHHGTSDFKFDAKLFFKCLRVGAPNAIGRMIELAAWSMNLHMMSWVSKTHVTVLAIGQNIFVLFAFVTDGLSKAVIAIASNFIGAKKWHKIPKMLVSSYKLQLMIVLILTVPLLIFPDMLINGFLAKTDASTSKQELILFAEIALVGVWFYTIFDLITWVFAGVLTAAGDTVFVMLTNAINAWVFAIVPIYFLIVRGDASPSMSWILTGIYGVANGLFFYLRYRGGKWKQKQLVN